MFRLCSDLVLSGPMVPLRSQSAFSLVELSIVLVILGLLTGGILGGQALIRAAELRAISSEHSRWVTAAQTFRDKYFTIPGDMNNATAFWGEDAAQCETAGPNGTPGTCNGNGDGMIMGGAANVTTEAFQLWKQLTLAGLVEGTYSGLNGPVPCCSLHAVIGTNAPRSRMRNAGWTAAWWTGIGNAETWATLQASNVLYFGGQHVSHVTYEPILRPEEAWNIDTKMDDGMPGRGRMLSLWNGGCTLASANNDFAAGYNLVSNANACRLMFQNAF